MIHDPVPIPFDCRAQQYPLHFALIISWPSDETTDASISQGQVVSHLPQKRGQRYLPQSEIGKTNFSE